MERAVLCREIIGSRRHNSRIDARPVIVINCSPVHLVLDPARSLAPEVEDKAQPYYIYNPEAKTACSIVRSDGGGMIVK